MRDWGLAGELFTELINRRSPSMFGSLQFLCFHLVAHVTLHRYTRAYKIHGERGYTSTYTFLLSTVLYLQIENSFHMIICKLCFHARIH